MIYKYVVWHKYEIIHKTNTIIRAKKMAKRSLDKMDWHEADDGALIGALRHQWHPYCAIRVNTELATHYAWSFFE